MNWSDPDICECYMVKMNGMYLRICRHETYWVSEARNASLFHQDTADHIAYHETCNSLGRGIAEKIVCIDNVKIRTHMERKHYASQRAREMRMSLMEFCKDFDIDEY